MVKGRETKQGKGSTSKKMGRQQNMNWETGSAMQGNASLPPQGPRFQTQGWARGGNTLLGPQGQGFLRRLQFFFKKMSTLFFLELARTR
jgi:hypothetical protein